VALQPKRAYLCNAGEDMELEVTNHRDGKSAGGRVREEEKSRPELENEANILAEQAGRLVSQLGVDVRDAERSTTGSEAFQQAADAYERLGAAQKRVDVVVWERTLIDGRDGATLMERLWNVRQSLWRLDEAADRIQIE
jgi:hypothetical protein